MRVLLIGLVAATVAGCARPPPIPAPELPPAAPAETDWPWWRGVNRDGVAAAGQSPPVSWSPTENIVWRVAVPGRGHGSPILWGDRVVLPTADEQAETQSLLCFDRRTGRQLWETAVHRGPFAESHDKNSHASATPACDGTLVFFPCLAQDGLWLTAVTLEGTVAWQRRLGDFYSRHGYAASPVVYRSLVIVAGDGVKRSFLTALNRQTGAVVWRISRPSHSQGTYASPVVGCVAERDQLLLNGPYRVFSYDPATGELLWTCDDPSESNAGTIALGETCVYASGGFPQRSLMCIRADGTGNVSGTHVMWSTKKHGAYVPSPVLHDGLLYLVEEAGQVTCFEAATGSTVWSTRLKGAFSSSATVAGTRLYVANEAGVVYVGQANRTWALLAENNLAEGGFASPAICGGRIYLRTLHALYCLGADADR